MMKHWLVCLFIAVAGSVGLATAQSSPVHSSSSKVTSKGSSKSASGSLKTASAPLTPKSAMPRPSKTSVAVPSAPKNNQNSELSQLERQNIKAASPKSKTAAAPKAAPAKSASTPSENLNFKYQKPAGGLTAARPDAHAASSSTPRVKKN